MPKGMLEFAGKPLIERQIDLFRTSGFDEIIIVKGFCQEKIQFPNVTYYINDRFDSTNMLASLFCAEEKLTGDVIISYADILFEKRLLMDVINAQGNIVVAVDENWKKYWFMRYGRIDFDTESLEIDNNDRILSLGVENPPLEAISARYVGLTKFTQAGVEELKRVWHKYKDEYWDKSWQVSGNTLGNAYMTDIIMAIIEEGFAVTALKTNNGWLEFDTNKDYENALEWHNRSILKSIIKID